ncbi:hypothetical protein [Bosea sp. AS-1]|uniref:hypothetical protein n=1 Tax=Bosea sp. AS-1 TaxID=2015316 RepID=UPI000B7755CD|nr:hypothetical protein [Bosea sp. AS-1]
MELAAVMGIWAAAGALAFWLFVRGWRREFDVTAQDAAILGLLSLMGPIAILVALLTFLLTALDDSKVIWKRVP